MDSYRSHQQQYIRPPPPPSTSDPYHYQQQQQPPPRPPLPPPPPQQQQGAWFPNQNQYQYHSLQSPPPQQQWGPPPHAEHLPPPPGSYPPPYSAHHYQPQSRPQGPPQSYHPQQFNQEWGAQIRPNNQSWDYPPVHNNEQDWAAMARAWASRTTVDNQEQQLQLVPAGRPEEQSHYYDQYPQSHYQQAPAAGAPTHQPPGSHPQDATSGYAHHNLVSASPSVNQQEVPSSYSSVTGKDASAELNEQSYNFLPMPNSSGHDGQHYMQQSHQTPFGYSSHSGDPTTNPADQPLEFASGFNVDHGGAHASTYAYHDSLGGVRGVDPATTMPSINTWTSSAAPGVVYPPHHPTLPSGTQPDMAIPSPIPGNAPHSFGSFPGLSLQPTIPTSGGTPFALTAGISGHPTVAFPGDTYGVSAISERPKKAAVPSWMREEVLKRGITRSTVDHPKEEELFVEDEGVDRSFGKGDQADSKSIDSSRSTEEEDNEDEVEAARTVAINKEIKRILTEVLSTVTDELFDEIATKVLSEDDPTPEVGHGRLPSNYKILPSTQEVASPKGSANVLILARPRESETEDISKKSSFSTPGDILGLANYATDDDDDDDDDGAIPSSGVLNSGKDDLQQSTIRKPHDAIANGTSSLEVEEHNRSQTSMPNDLIKASSIDSKSTLSDIDSRMKLDQRDQQESKGNSLKDKEVEGGKRRTDEKGENHRRLDERPSRKERTDDQNGSKENIKDQKVKLGERAKESDTRKRSSHSDVEEDRRERRDSSKEDVSRKRERTKSKGGDRTSHKYSTNSRHKRRHSSSIDSKDNVVNHANHSSDESSEDSERKLHSRRRHLSPSPVRSRKRQVSRSPHSKHSQRRHSPYSSLDSNRGEKSRSKSPVRRQR